MLAGQRKLKLVAVAEGEGVEAAGAEGLGKFAGEAVQREHALRLHEFDEAEEVVEVGVVGERERRVAPHPVNRARIDRHR